MRSPFPSREVIVAKKMKQEREGKVKYGQLPRTTTAHPRQDCPIACTQIG